MAAGKELRKGRYVLVRPLGEGSQGATWEAIDHGETPRKVDASAGAYGAARNLSEDFHRYVERAKKGVPSVMPVAPGDRSVAIKCFRVGSARSWKDVELAEREARTLAALDHPKLPRYVEHFEEDGGLYLVMEKIEGESLAAIRKRRGLAPDEVVRMLEDLAEALRYLHGRAPFIVHRDIKPGNVIRRPDGSFALVDFGAVRDRLRPAGGSTVVGTFGYMAPEQFQGRASPKSDVYGAGATAIALLTGTEPEELPHDGLAIDVDRSVPRGTAPGLVRALKAMLVPDPDRRVDSLDEALAFVRTTKAPSRPAPAAAPPPPAAPKLTRKERRAARAVQKREERLARRERQRMAAERAAPMVPRLLGQLVLTLAMTVVWLTVELVVPLLLAVLSLGFGKSLRRAATATTRAGARARARLLAAFWWLSGYRSTDQPAATKPRVASEIDRVYPVDQATALRIAIAKEDARGVDPERWIEERIAEQEAEAEAEAEAARKTRRRRG